MEFSIYCSECGEEMKPGELAVAATTGVIWEDGGFYADTDEPWLWVKHSVCPQEETIT